MGTTKAYGRLDTRRTIEHGVTQIGSCTECKNGVFSDQEYTRVRRPTIGLNHNGCMPAEAVMAP